MTEIEYKEKVKILKKEHDDKLIELAKECAHSNNTHKIGDIVTDHIGSIVIEKFRLYFGLSSLPSMIYYGTELKKDGTPTKKGGKRDVYQDNLI